MAESTDIIQERGIIAWMARNPVAANLLMVLIMVMGVKAVLTMKKEVFPTFPSDTLTVTVPFPASSPEDVEEGVIIKIEEAIQDLDGIKEIRSQAKEGSGVVTIELDTGYSTTDVLNKVKVRIDGIASFPAEAEEPIVDEVIRRIGVNNITISGSLTEKQLKKLADEIRDDLLANPNITQISTNGTRNYEISIELSDVALRQYGLRLDDVVTAVRNRSRDLPGGKLRTDSRTVTLRSEGQAYTAEEFSVLTLINRPDGTRVTLGDVAEVKDGFVDQPVLSRLNGQPSVTLRIKRVGRQDSLAIAEIVRKYAKQKQAKLPPGIKLDVWGDATNILKGRINLLLKSAVQGAVLVAITLALFLHIKLAFWVVMGIPFCFLGTLFVMNIGLVDVSINVISLFGFIMVLGIIVDDAIVTAESAYHALETENQGINSIIRGVKRVSVATVFGVLTTIIAFLPSLILEDGIGRFFSVMGVVVIVSLVFSLIETKLILPTHLRHIRIANGSRSSNPFVSFGQGIQEYCSEGMKNFVTKRYKPFLIKAVKNRYTTMAIFIGALIIALSLVPSGLVRFVFFPKVPSDFISINVTMPQGTPYQLTHEYALRIETAAMKVNELYRDETGDEINAIKQIQVLSTTDTFISVTAELVPSTERDIDSERIAGWWRTEIGELSGLKSMSIDATAGRNSLAIDVELRGGDLLTLRKAAAEIKASLREYDGVFDVRDTFDAGGPEVDIRITPQGESLGLGQTELARQVRQSFFGAEIQRVQRGKHEVRVYARFPKSERDSIEALHSMWIRLPNGKEVPFDVVGEIVESTGVSAINRIDRTRVVNIQADVDKSRIAPSKVLDSLKDGVLADINKHYPSVKVHLGGEAEEQEQNTTALKLGSLVVLILIFAALAIPLKSYGQPLIIMSVIPFGAFGAIAGHLLLGKDLSIISIIGIVALIGIVVNDSLVLVDYINQERKAGLPWRTAVLTAGERRFRAVVLTSATTFMGLLPIQLEASIQAQFLKPMAISVAFGVLFATTVTLILVPILIFVVNDIRRQFYRLIGKERPREYLSVDESLQ